MSESAITLETLFLIGESIFLKPRGQVGVCRECKEKLDKVVQTLWKNSGLG